MANTKLATSSFDWLDRPIKSKNADRLDRARFSHDLARTIASWDGTDSIVVGLYGNWGSGKTSIKNMLIEALNNSIPNPPIVVEFNPWRVSGFDQLSENFFAELWNKLPGNFKNLRKIFNEYREQLDSADINMGVFKVTAKQKKATLEDLRIRLLEEFEKCSKRFLIILDDVDRLPQKQISLLFQIIKANADFPKLAYLVLFHKSIVAKALSHEYQDGNLFIEKIIQVPFDVPEPSRFMIQQALFDGLNRLISGEHINKRFDKRRWINIFVQGIAPYFKTLRDVNRFLSILSFTIGLFTRDGCFEVNTVDLIALETLRVFEPDIYHQLPNFKSSLVKPTSTNESSVSKPLMELVGNLGRNTAAAKELLKGLFPNSEWIFGGTRYSDGYQKEWIQELRVGTEEFFDRYFALSISESDIAQKDIEDILKIAGDRHTLAAKLNDFKKRGLIFPLLERLDAHTGSIGIKNAIPFISAICDVSDDLPVRQGFLSLGADVYAWRIVYFYLLQETDASKRFKILKQAIQDTTGLFLPVKIVASEEPRKDGAHSEIKRLISDRNLLSLKKLCSKKIKAQSNSGLINQLYLSHILYRWKDFANPNIVKRWIQKQLKTKEGFFAILQAFSQKTYSQSLGEHATRINLRMDVGFLDFFQVKSNIGSALKKYAKHATKEEQKYIHLLKDAMENKKDPFRDSNIDSEYI